MLKKTLGDFEEGHSLTSSKDMTHNRANKETLQNILSIVYFP